MAKHGAGNVVVADVEGYLMANPIEVTVKTVNVRRAKWRLFLSYYLLVIVHWIGVVAVMEEDDPGE